MNLPKDVAAYLVQAAQELITEQCVEFASPEEFKAWADENMVNIAERAMQLQRELYNKVFGDKKILEAVTTVVGAKVWGEANTTEVNKQVNRSISDALRR